MKKLLLLLFFCFSLISNAQDGSLDTSFNSSDIGFGNGDAANDAIYTSAIQPDGKIIIGGRFITYNGTARNYITRLNPDGSLDTSFNPGTGANDVIRTIALQSDGKIIIGGQFTTYRGTARNYIARLNANGSLDTSFNSGAGANSFIYTTSLQPDGKIIIGGSFTVYSGTARNRIARLNSDGTLDTSFDPGTGANNTIYTTSLQPDGKIIIGGEFYTYNSVTKYTITRLNTDGTLDTSFTGAGANTKVQTTALQADGKIIIGGEFDVYNGTFRNHIARLNSDGTLDTTFNPGTGTNSYVFTISIQPDGKIIIGGEFSTYNGSSRSNIARLDTDGTLDTSFNPSTGTDAAIETISLQADGKIIIGGSFTTYNDATRNRITRLNPDGNLDISFNPGMGANYTIYTTSIQADGKIVIGGWLTLYNSTPINYIARLNTDGTLDTSFNPGLGADNHINTISIQADGKIIIGGEFHTYNGLARTYIARLNTDGSLDTSFNPPTGGSSGYVQTISIQSDGKIIVGGEFYNLTCIARLNSDGSLDTSFNPGTGTNSTIHTTTIQTDGKIIIGGQFTTYNGTARNYIACLNTDGSLDTSFNSSTGANYVIRTTSLQPDGKIIIGGDFTAYNGTTRNSIARLNTDGTLDTSFNPGTGSNNTILTTSIQADGKIIIGGLFTSYNGTTRNRIARLNSDGTLDTSFNPGTGTNNIIKTTTLQSDGKIIIGGDFTAYNGTGRNRIARLNNTTLGTKSNALETNEVIVYNNDTSLFVKSLNSTLKSVFVYDITGKKIYENKNVNSNELKIDSLTANHQILIIKITDVTNKTLNRKVFF